jgi:hypothetical protein
MFYQWAPIARPIDAFMFGEDEPVMTILPNVHSLPCFVRILSLEEHKRMPIENVPGTLVVSECNIDYHNVKN